MGRNSATSKVVDEVLRYGALGVAGGVASIAPNALLGLHKPLDKLLNHLDKRDRDREIRRVLYYMKERGYLVGEYEHGLQLTKKARKRLQQTEEELVANRHIRYPKRKTVSPSCTSDRTAELWLRSFTT